MSDRIAASLRRLFEEHRIVFWYDTDRDMRAEFDALELSGVTKLDIANNEFGLKYRILRQEPDGRFLLFKDGPEPPMAENWLLDMQLATTVFKADQAAIWVAELGLPLQFENVVRAHIGFFGAKPRVEVLKSCCTPPIPRPRCA
ncbi:hypothetical protein MF410_15000 [Rhizobium sp. C104]|uniref:hypothetical protein n=1 Tax=Rhizobium sp. C104 TaxID=2917727 RepID=UPI001EF7CCB4|nr:hypothetical protein [Rhizobium sp. C104]ULJ77355.1 hypothetical protein MF410_15000 [Rhizobium sp. C104]